VVVTVVRGWWLWQSYLTAHLAQHLAYRLRHLLYDQMQRSSFAYHDRARRRTHVACTADVEAVVCSSSLLAHRLSVPDGTGTMVAMAADWRLLGLTLVSLPFFWA